MFKDNAAIATENGITNPVQDNLTIKVMAGTGLLKPVSIRILDAKGQVINEEQVLGSGMNTIPMHSLKAVIYWIVEKW